MNDNISTMKDFLSSSLAFIIYYPFWDSVKSDYAETKITYVV